MEGKEERVAVLVYFKKEDFERLLLIAEFLGVSVADVVAKMFKVGESLVGTFDDRTKRAMVEKVLENLKRG